jgi:hypothetical protein
MFLAFSLLLLRVLAQFPLSHLTREVLLRARLPRLLSEGYSPMPNLHTIATIVCAAELAGFKEPWSYDDCYEIILLTHDQLECLSYHVPMDRCLADRYRHELEVTKKLMVGFLERDPDMPKKFVREYQERLRPLKERLRQ